MTKVILGSGISGLSAGHYLLKKYPNEIPVIIEATDRVGGWIKSTKLQDSAIFEQGPRTIRPKGPAGANTLKLLEELNLTDKIRPIPSTHPAATNRMVYVNKELHLLPSSLGSLFRKQAPFSKPLIAYLLTENFKPAKHIPEGDESIYDFTNRRLGREISDYLISPMICGICGGNAKEISVKFLMESLFEKEQKYGSITKGLIGGVLESGNKEVQVENSGLQKLATSERWSVYSFKGGIEILPNALYHHLIDKGVEFKFKSVCTDVKFGDEISVGFNTGEVIKTERLISAIPAYKLGELVKEQHPELGELLGNIKNVSLGVVNLKYNRRLLEKEGFGFLVAPQEDLPILGVIYDSCCFPNEDNTILTVMLGGHWFNKHFGDNPSEKLILDTALEQVNRILKIDYEPDEVKVNLLKDCIPQYHVGHYANLQRINDYIKGNHLGLSLCGASYYGVGVNDVILSAKRAVAAL